MIELAQRRFDPSPTSLFSKAPRWIGVAIFLSIFLLPFPVMAIELRNSNRSTLNSTQSTEIELFGADLRDAENQPASVWTSFESTVEAIEPEGTDRGRVRYRITPMNPIAGIVAVRVYHRDEVSQAMLFYVKDDANERLPAVDSNPVSVPSSYDFQTKGLGYHRIPIELMSGRPFVAEVIGERLGSEIDPILILQNQMGEEVAFADDHPIIGSDPILHYQPAETGVFYLLVRDVEYRGGLRMFLNLGDEPVSGTAFPNALGIDEMRRIDVTPIEHNVMGNPLEETNSHPAKPPASYSALAVSRSNQVGFTHYSLSGRVVAMFQTEDPVRVEGELSVLPVPGVFCGRLSSGNSEDTVDVFLEKGTRFVVSLLGSRGPWVGRIRLFQNDRRVAEHHWGADPNGRLRYEVPETGMYRLEIRDYLGRTGPGFEYALHLDHEDVSAILKIADSKKREKRRNERPHRLAVDAGETLELSVRVDRRGLQGPIRLCAWLDGMPCSSVGEIPADRSDVDFSIRIPESDVPMRLQSMVIRGYSRQKADKQRSSGAMDSARVTEIPLDLTEHLSRDHNGLSRYPVGLKGMMLVVSPTKEDTQDEVEQKE